MLMWNQPPPPLVAKAEPITGQKLSLEQAIRLALRENPNLLAAYARIGEADGKIGEARANRNLALTSTLTVTGLDRTQKGTVAIPGVAPFSFVTVPRDQSQFLLSADLPIDLSGQIRQGIRLATVGKEAVRYQSDATRNQIVISVRDAYYTVLQAQELVRVAEEAVRNAEEQERTAQSYVRAGTATRFDSLRAATQTADAKQQLLIARNRVTLTLAALKNRIGLPQTSVLELILPEVPALTIPSWEEATKEAERSRPELLAAAAQVRASEVSVRLAEGSDDPTLGFSASYQRSPRPGFGSAEELSAISLRLSVPLYDRGLRRANTQQARAVTQERQRVYDAARNDVFLEVQEQLLTCQEAEERLKVASAALSQAQEQYRLAENRYKAGVNLRGDFSSPLLEISDARTALTQAQTNVVNARFDVFKAQTRLEGAMGRFSRLEEVKP